MIVEHHEHIDDDFRVSVPTVRPWTRYPECPKCGGRLGAGLFLASRLLAALGRCAQNYTYCRGDQNSQTQVAGMKFGPDGPEVVATNINVPCFGVIEEHLHIRCGRCSFDWLMAVKGK